MAKHPLFIEDSAVSTALEHACALATQRLVTIVPELAGQEGELFREQLLAHLSAMVTGHPGASPIAPALPQWIHGADAFGDAFDLDTLPLPRQGSGYAVQRLNTDTLLDRQTGDFLPVREPLLEGLYPSFEAARSAAAAWLKARNSTADREPLAIVPAYFDDILQRHVLIYGVLTAEP